MEYAPHIIRLIMQLRRNGVTDAATLAAIEKTPRELFVEDAFADQAYDDRALPIAQQQTISQPTIVGLMTQAAQLNDRSVVLEIGTGSGYQAAILAAICRRVHTIELHERLFKLAKQRFEKLKLTNITQYCGDGSKGWAAAAPYDAIMVTCAAFGDVPPALLAQLSDVGGRLVIPIEDAHSGAQTLYCITKHGGELYQEALCSVRFVPLVAA
jgi:protein-L-isoaspartate(D-aspartate) O-methyltransferase